MRLRIVNEFCIETGEGEVRRLRTRKTEELLAWLALHAGRFVSREELMGMLWPEEDPHDLRTRLRLALHSIRSIIGAHLLTDGDLVRVDGIVVDVNEIDFRTIPLGWRLLPEHQAEWIDAYQAALLSQLHLRSLSSAGTNQVASDSSGRLDRTEELLYLISTDPLEPDWYSKLFKVYMKKGSRAAAQCVAVAARNALGESCPPGLVEAAKRRGRSDFVGRIRDLTEISEHLLGPDEPVGLALVGLGGIGKSEIARELILLAQAESIETVWVSCDSMRSIEERDSRIEAALRSHFGLSIHEKVNATSLPSTLMVLDDLHLKAAAESTFIAHLLDEGSGIRLFVTSQVEVEFVPCRALSRLSLPLASDRDSIERSETGALLLNYSNRTFVPSESQLWFELCGQSGGIPLAIRIIAGRLKYDSLESVLKGVKGGTLNRSVGADRSISLLSSLEYSFHQLGIGQQSALRTLAHFEGRFDSFGFAYFEIFNDHVAQLCDLQWVQYDSDSRAYWLLAPVREFLLTENRDSENQEAFVRFALEIVDDQFESNFAEVTRIASVYAEDFELISRHSLGLEERLRLALLSVRYLLSTKRGTSGEILRQMLEVAEIAGPRIWNQIGAIYYFGSDFDSAAQWFHRLTGESDKEWQGVGWSNLGLIEFRNNRFQLAADLIRKSIFTTNSDRRRWTRMINLASPLMVLGDITEARSVTELALHEMKVAGSLPVFQGLGSLCLGVCAFLSGDDVTAEALALSAVESFEEAQQWFHLTDAFGLLIMISGRNGRTVQLVDWGQRLIKTSFDSSTIALYFYAGLRLLGQSDLARSVGVGVQPQRLSAYSFVFFHRIFEESLAEISFSPGLDVKTLVRNQLKRL
jgi:tetratricopeptide (TPR) repeat protein